MTIRTKQLYGHIASIFLFVSVDSTTLTRSIEGDTHVQYCIDSIHRLICWVRLPILFSSPGELIHLDARFSVFNPANGQILQSFAPISANEVDATIADAQNTFNSGIWSKAPAITRSKVLARLARILEEQVPEIARSESLQTGRTIREMNAQLGRLPDWLDYYAALLRTRQDFIAPTQGKLLNYVQRVPLGVVAQITPFNHPLLIAIKKIAPALAAGNSVIVKPSEQAPLTVLEFAKMAAEAGLPPGVLSVIPGFGHTIGKVIVSNPLIRKVDITAGTETGRVLGSVVGSNLAAYTAELGGKAPIVIFDDADIESAVNGTAFASFVASGQTCVSGTRIIVQNQIYDEFLERFLSKVQSIRARMGNPMNPKSTMGSVISSRQLERIEAMVGRAKGKNRIIAGGTRMTGKSDLDGFDFSGGSFYPPTVITDISVEDELWQEEVFGPVVVVKRFTDESEGVALANACKYGLGAGIWTTDLSKAHRIAADIEAGLCWVNTHHRNDPSSPWGGMKESGIGRENGLEAFEAYSQSKSTIVNVATSEETRTTDDWFADGSEMRRYG
ncbi:aldehyde dehydrogenase domain-containing protein [Lentinula aciculospora]|uniref:Aldehyde dehydrogenase domain-containing protein n=1 Tax=Lentinula aciculospora TaxID=153920 RepID=A0A9W9AC81_9AGAR|nr:aldehyde dehydrogenase domain-containing protein [Lentinula aciculospora]